MTAPNIPIHVCIGTEPKTEIPMRVLMYSIVRNTNTPVQFHIMEGSSWEKRSEVKHGEGTGFSLRRWDIPKYFDYEGCAIYLDADQLVLGDIKELWDQQYNLFEECIACTYQPDKWFSRPEPNTSVMVMDNHNCKLDHGWMDNGQLLSHLQADIDRKRYVRVMHAHHLAVRPYQISNSWNSLNRMDENTKLIHYTKEPEQPWYKPSHKFAGIWGKWFRMAVEDNMISIQQVEKAVSIYKPHTSQIRGQGLHPYWFEMLKKEKV